MISATNENETNHHERSIAVVGISCRFPGAKSYSEYWNNLLQGVNSITTTSQRWDIDKFYSSIPETANKTISKWSGLIEGIDKFDAGFFGISPREASRIDPQQRILLELSWSCLEDAGYSPLELSGNQIGVFIGVCNSDYNQIQHQNGNIQGHTATGTYTCMIANRISYFFNFHGPSVPVDTACSSSLVALHQAINSIQAQECQMALVGGINILCTPTSYISFSQLGMLSPTGQCKTFDSQADGYVRGEGAGIILLKPLEQARLDRDQIYGVIKGSAVNHGGKARTLTAPNIYAQTQVLRAAYTQANIAPNTVSYIETHGTGTPLGDPIEINSLKRSFKQLHQHYGIPAPQNPYCGLGAVKTNIGHTEAAAGIAGLIKVLLSIKNKKIPKIINFQKLNTRIDLKHTPFYLVRETQEWKPLITENGEIVPRRAGVSSFGFGGVNAHIVLEEPPEQDKLQTELAPSFNILTLSAKTKPALQDLAQNYIPYLQSQNESEIADICYTSTLGRAHFEERLAIVAESKQELEEKLLEFVNQPYTYGVIRGTAPSAHSQDVAFLFTGQGSQSINMGRQLYERHPTFRQVLDECDTILKSYLEVPLLKVLYPDESQPLEASLIHQTAYTQPALFAVEYALAKLWESWGIKPSIVMGHSVGEYVAACISGVFTLEEGLKLIAMRGQLMQRLPPGGQMVSVLASETQVKAVIKNYSKQVSIAAFNGQRSIVISGEIEALAAICSQLESLGIKTKTLQVSHAFHSPLMEPMIAEFEAIAKRVTYRQPKIPLVSNVTGIKVGEEVSTAQYWVNHIKEPVRFAQSMVTLCEQGYENFLEIGPKPVLLGMGRECLPEEGGLCLPSLRPGIPEWQQMLSSLGEFYVKGAKVNWLGFYESFGFSGQKVSLPTYPFQGEKYWIEDSEINEGTSIINLLNQGEISPLTERLRTVEDFSPHEVDLLPKLLKCLVKQHRQELGKAGIHDYFYSIDWREKVGFGQTRLIQPVDMERQSILGQLELKEGTSENILTLLEKIGIEYIIQALDEMGWSYQPTELFSLERVTQKLGIVNSQKQLFNRILQVLVQEGMLKKRSQQWEVVQELPPVNPSQIYQSRLQKYPDIVAELTLLHRCASQLSAVLRGAIDPVQLVFPEGDLTAATHLYQESPTAQAMNTIVQRAVSQVIEKLPPRQGVRILEIGAGTGGTTAYLLPHLQPSRTQYVFTDLGPLFLRKAQEKFQDYSFVSYQTLDIESDLEQQNVDLHQYDIAIAANVLHATENLKQTLNNVHQLLAPGGLIVLLEVATQNLWLDLVFGLLEGWWRFQDYELRPDYPLLNRLQWQQLLKETGFSEPVILPEQSGQLDLSSDQVVMIAQAEETARLEDRAVSQHWLILADPEGIAQHLATHLRSVGHSCTLVFPGENYQKIGAAEFILNPHHPLEFGQMMTEIVQQSSLYGVVQCWTLERGDILQREPLNEWLKSGCGATLSLVQELVKLENSQPPKLWVVTQGVQPLPEPEPLLSGLAQSPVWGMAKVIDLEHPELNCVRVDLDPTESVETQALNLLDELHSREGENQVAFRGQRRYVSRLVPNDLATPSIPPSLGKDVTYLIAGGLGGLGLLVAGWMIEQGAQHLVLLSRRSPDALTAEKLAQLKKSGCSVTVERADVSDLDAITQVCDRINRSPYPLAGVIHAAGMLSDAVLQNQTWSSFEPVMKAKIEGAWNLHQLTKNQPLDFFILFSSVASLFGSSGQSNHAAANAFLDHLAHYRRSMGLPALSIHWGTVSKVGEAAERGADIRLQQQGLNAISPDEVLEALAILLTGELTEVGVVNVDWSIWEDRIAHSPFLEDWQQKATATEVTPTVESNIAQQLSNATPKERRSLLISHLRNQMGPILGLKNVSEIGLEDKFFELGMDSLTSVELRNKLQRNLEITLPSTLAFDYPTIDKLVEYLLQQLSGSPIANSPSSIPEQQEDTLEEDLEERYALIQDLSEEEVEELINQKLNALLED